MISVNDSDIFNILVDMSSIDSMVLVENKDEARRLMDHPPRNARVVSTGDIMDILYMSRMQLLLFPSLSRLILLKVIRHYMINIIQLREIIVLMVYSMLLEMPP